MSVSKFTPEVRRTVLDAFRDNPSVASAAAKAGITAATLRSWLRKGENGDPEFTDFAAEAAEQRRYVKDEIVKSLYQIATDPLHPQATKAANQLLTTLYGEEFSAKQTLELKKSDDAETFDMSVLETDELRELNRIVKKLKAANAPKPLRHEHNPPVLELKPDGEEPN